MSILTRSRCLVVSRWLAAAVLLAGMSATAFADGGVTFTDIAAGGGSGLAYSRAPSPTVAVIEALKSRPVLRSEIPTIPLYANGTPGVVIFDFDNDGDEDIFVTNGLGVANSLFSNQLRETGSLRFIDVANAAKIADKGLDAFGACAGDTDNDGDKDLLVLGNHMQNRFYENRGDGTFREYSVTSHLDAGVRTHTSCSMGDLDNDGLLDVVIANAYDNWSHQLVIVDPFRYNEHNQVFMNRGRNRFVDVSASSGIQNLSLLPAAQAGKASLTWAIAVVDYDQDGDSDIIQGDDQEVPLPPAALGGIDLGLVRVFNNNGRARFTDVTAAVGAQKAGVWMGLSFGDLNCDGHMDMFATNGGDYVGVINGNPLGAVSSEWLLGQPGGTFTRPGVGSLVATPFGWGTSMLDYDNDGDLDIVFHGGNDFFNIVDASPGGLLQNQGCTASFMRDSAALATSTDHVRRIEYGVAVGDLDDDGFVDIVSASSFDIPASAPLISYPFILGSPFDVDSLRLRYFPTITGSSPPTLSWAGTNLQRGSLSVEINSGGNGNGSAAFRLLGTKGLVDNREAVGGVNRDGIGAIVRFTPDGGKTTLKPIVAGSSYGSQDSLIAHFGLGAATEGTVEVQWPGGVRNRLYDVAVDERVLLPEIPCSFDTSASRKDYAKCVKEALKDVRRARLVNQRQFDRLEESALRAFDEEH